MPTDVLESSCLGFSCPFEEFDRTFAEAVAAEYAAEVVRVFLQRFEGAVSEAGKGITTLLSGLANGRLGLDIAWSSEIGNAHRAVLMDDAGQALRAAAALGVVCMANGAAASWEISLAMPSSFLWDNWLLPPCDRLIVVGTGSQATITCSLKGQLKEVSFTVSRGGTGWQCAAQDEVQRLFQLNTPEGSITLLPRFSAKDFGFLERGGQLYDSYGDELVSAIRLSLDSLRESGSPYYDWVTRGIRRIVITESRQGILETGSRPKLHRAVFMSRNLEPLAIAEMMVHDASHQYHDFIRLLGDTVDPSITRLYYSPLVGFPRSLEHVLMVYHSFANVMLFYVDAADRGLDRDGVVGGLRSELAENLRQLALPLGNERILTPTGRALVEPLIKRAILAG